MSVLPRQRCTSNLLIRIPEVLRCLLSVRRLVTVLRVQILTIHVVALMHPSRLVAAHHHIAAELVLPSLLSLFIIIESAPFDIGVADLLRILMILMVLGVCVEQFAGGHLGDPLEMRSALLRVRHLAKLVELASCYS